MLKIIKNLFQAFKEKEVDISNKPIPCINCGACCSYFVVSFDNKYNPQVPLNKIIYYHNGKSVMKGTEKLKGRCISLVGEIVKSCYCSIYNNRPNVCSDFPVWLKNGKQNPKCIKARKYHGLPALGKE